MASHCSRKVRGSYDDTAAEDMNQVGVMSQDSIFINVRLGNDIRYPILHPRGEKGETNFVFIESITTERHKELGAGHAQLLGLDSPSEYDPGKVVAAAMSDDVLFG